MSNELDTKLITETDIKEAVDLSLPKANVILDSQILTALMTCARFADFRFNHNLLSIRGKSSSLECGSIVHKFLEEYYKHIIKGIDKQSSAGFAYSAAQLYIQGCQGCKDFVPTHADGIGLQGEYIIREDSQHECGKYCILKPPCGHQPNEYEGVINTPPDSGENQWGQKVIGWKYVLDTCEQYVDYYRNDFWVPLETEVVKSKIIYEDDEIRILWKAKLDLVFDTNQGIFPTDHKTMKQNRQSVLRNNQFMGQCIIQNTQSMIINKIGFQTTLKPKEKFIREMKSYSSDLLLEQMNTVIPYYAKQMVMWAQTGYWPPNLTSCDGKYGKCAFNEVCDATLDMREEVIKKNFIVGPEWNPTNPDDEE